MTSQLAIMAAFAAQEAPVQPHGGWEVQRKAPAASSASRRIISIADLCNSSEVIPYEDEFCAASSTSQVAPSPTSLNTRTLSHSPTEGLPPAPCTPSLHTKEQLQELLRQFSSTPIFPTTSHSSLSGRKRPIPCPAGGGGEGDDDADQRASKGRRALQTASTRLEKHKELERKRRARTKNLLTELASLLPGMESNDSECVPMNKVLAGAVLALKKQRCEDASG
mmetsp:Transcript_19142/g.44124  ORF Transcript_19142/g.44124 Transcript_19142/m.44124 type:complete len:223 (+) Transcript_19142:38-706(+)